MDSINKRLELLESLKPQKGDRPGPYAERFAQMSDETLEILMVCLEACHYSVPGSVPWPNDEPAERPWGCYARQFGFADGGDNKLSGAQVQSILLAREDLILGRPPLSDDVFTARVKSIMKGESA
jgi:hypothetical protein